MTQAIALAAVQDAIAAQHPDLTIELVAQVHYIRPGQIAHIDVYRCDDAMTRRAIRANAVRLLQHLGVRVELVGGHDVHTVSPDHSDPTAVMHYRKQLDLIADLEAPNEPSASVLPPFRVPPDAEVEAEFAEVMPLLLRMEAAIRDSDKDDD